VALYQRGLALEGEVPAVEEHAYALIARALIALNTRALDEAERLASQARSISLAPRNRRDKRRTRNRRQRPRLLAKHLPEEFLTTMRQDPDVTSLVFDAHRRMAEYCLHGERGHEPVYDVALKVRGFASRSNQPISCRTRRAAESTRPMSVCRS
jgi:hypothetical protein